MTGEVLEIQNLSKRFDGIRALAEFSCEVRRDEILGVIGPNGAGKTTLFNIVTGFIRPERGRVLRNGENVTGLAAYKLANRGMARTFQDLRLIRQISVLDNVLVSFRGQPGESLVNIFFRWRMCKQHEALNREKAIRLLGEAGIAEKAGEPAENLSYGQQKLLSIVSCLAADADLLLLDEPVAGIAPEMREKILGIIRGLPAQGKSVILIEHDLDAVMTTCDRVIFMDAGRKVCEGTPEEVRNDPRVIEAYID
jgi:ABC-type branched-subunit amino acid transport system ATPase component